METLKENQTLILNMDFRHIKELIERVNNNDNSALQHLNLYFDGVIKGQINFWSKLLGKHHREDIEAVALGAVYEATCQFKGNSSKLYFKYVNKRIESRIIDYKRSEEKHLNKFVEFQDIDEYHNFINNISDNFNYEAHCISSISLAELCKGLNDCEKHLFYLMYAKKLSDKDIAKELGISYDSMRQRKKALKEKAEKYLK